MDRLRKAFDKLFWRLSDALTPGLVNSQHQYLAALRDHLRPGIDWLDVGCGHQLVPGWIKSSEMRERELLSRAGRVVGIDLDFPAMRRHRSIGKRAMASLTALPFADESFDLVTANMVVEHLDDPAAALAQVGRVLRPGGAFLFHTPNAGHPLVLLSRMVPQEIKHRVVAFFENRPEGDVFPTRYRMNSAPAVRRLSRQAGLGVAELRLVETSPNTLMLGPLVVVELCFIRATRHRSLAWLRGDMVTALRKPANQMCLAA